MAVITGMGLAVAAASLIAAPIHEHPLYRSEHFEPRHRDRPLPARRQEANPAGTKFAKRLKAGKKLWRL